LKKRLILECRNEICTFGIISKEESMKKVLFVCTGNTCRSSMAEAIAKKILCDMGRAGEIDFSSAGVYAIPGDKASCQAVQVMKELGIDLAGHRARRIDKKLIDQADIILTMTESHKAQVLSMHPEAISKVYTLMEYADGKTGNIQDPFGQPVDEYRKCSIELKEYLLMAINKILSR